MLFFHRKRSATPENPLPQDEQRDHGSSSDAAGGEDSTLPPYFHDLDDVQKQIYRRPFGPDGFPIDAWTDPYYETWFYEHRASEQELQEQRRLQATLAHRPTFSFIVPLYKTPLDYLSTMADSVLAQTYQDLQLVLVNASPELPELAEAVESYRQRDPRVSVVTLQRNLGITENTNHGLAAATGDFCCFLDHDDFIEPNLLFEYASALNEDPTIDFIYCDEDMVESSCSAGNFRHRNPLFKPDYSPELLLCKNYVMHLLTIRRSLVMQMPQPDSRYDGTQDYNMLLHCSGLARSVHHVQKVLYHWRISEKSTATNPEAKPYDRKANKLSIFDHLSRNHIDGSIVASGLNNLHNIWMNGGFGSASLIVDCTSCGENDIRSFLLSYQQNGKTDNCEVLLVIAPHRCSSDIVSDDSDLDIKVVIPKQAVTGFEALNLGAKQASGSALVFLDSRCSFITPEPLRQLLGLRSLDGVGISSPKTLYRDGRTKSFGIAVTSERITPLYRGYPDDFPAYQCNARAFQNVSACSYQGLCISRDLFLGLGGFDERMEGEIAAADLCRRVLQRGLRVVVSPTIKLEVDEPSPKEPYDRLIHSLDYGLRDLELFDKKWPGVRAAGDPYYNSNFDQASPYNQLPRP